jgi:hypothetical protein
MLFFLFIIHNFNNLFIKNKDKQNKFSNYLVIYVYLGIDKPIIWFRISKLCMKQYNPLFINYIKHFSYIHN